MTGFVVTGTDTEIGKSVFAAGLTSLIGARYWKPVQAGLESDEFGSSDRERVMHLSGASEDRIHREAYSLTTPCSPHQAADIDGVTIDPERLALPGGTAPLVVEGAGGVLVPLSDDVLYADLFARWQLPDDVLFWDSIPLTSTGKLDKKSVRAALERDGYLLPDLR